MNSNNLFYCLVKKKSSSVNFSANLLFNVMNQQMLIKFYKIEKKKYHKY